MRQSYELKVCLEEAGTSRKGDCWFKDNGKEWNCCGKKWKAKFPEENYKIVERTRRISQHSQHLRRTLKREDPKVWKEFQQSGEGHSNKKTWESLGEEKERGVGGVVGGGGGGEGGRGSKWADPILPLSNYCIFFLAINFLKRWTWNSCSFTICWLLYLLPSTQSCSPQASSTPNSSAFSPSFISIHHFMSHLLP